MTEIFAASPLIASPTSAVDANSDVSFSLPDVHAKRSQHLHLDPSQDSTHISAQSIKLTAQQSLLETIAEHSADLYISSRGTGIHGIASGASGSINIRGLGGSPNTQILIVEDDLPDYQGIFGHPLPDAYVPALVESVKLNKGGSSVRFGSNAMGGLIAIKSRWRKEHGHELHADLSYGSHQTARTQLAYLGNWATYKLTSAVSWLQTKGHRSGIGGDQLLAEMGIQKKLTSSQSLQIKQKYVQVSGADPGPVSHPHNDHWFRVKRSSLQLHWRHKNQVGELSLHSTANIGRHRLYDGFRSWDYITHSSLEWRHPITKTFSYTIGSQAQTTGGQVDHVIEATKTIEHMQEYAMFALLHINPFKFIQVNAGIRGLTHSSYGMNYVYKAGVHMRPFEDVQIGMRLAKNYRNPTMRELYLPYPVANPALKPEYATTMDSYIRYSIPLFSIKCAVYQTNAQNMLKYFGSWPTAEIVNIGQLRIHGLESSFIFSPFRHIQLHSSINVQDSGEYTKQSPSMQIKSSINYTYAHKQHRITIFAKHRFIHGIYMENYQRQALSDISVVDCGIHYHNEGSQIMRFEPYLHINNLLNQPYEHIANYPMPGFSIFAGLRMKLE